MCSLCNIKVPDSFPVQVDTPRGVSVSIYLPTSGSYGMRWHTSNNATLPHPRSTSILLESVPFTYTVTSDSPFDPSLVTFVYALSQWRPAPTPEVTYNELLRAFDQGLLRVSSLTCSITQG